MITGGGGGLGRLLAMRLVRLGVRVIMWDISQEGKLYVFTKPRLSHQIFVAEMKLFQQKKNHPISASFYDNCH